MVRAIHVGSKGDFWKKYVGIVLLCIGVWVFPFTIPSNYFTALLDNPTFLQNSLSASLRNTAQKDTNTSPLTDFVLRRWSFLQLTTTPINEPDVSERVVTLLPATPQPVPNKEVQEEEIPSDSATGDWILKTMLPTGTHVKVGDIYVANSGKVSVENTTIPTVSPITLEQYTEEPQILIYHSHGTESYTPTTGYEYEESDPFRTLEEGRNIITVGEGMAEVFENAGYAVIHDKTLHDYPDYNASYGNSSVTLQTYLAQYPSIELIFDVHRDALEGTDGTPYQLVSQQGEDLVAQVMLVVGSNGDGYTHDNWRENFDLALTLQQGLLEYGDFARPVTLRSSRFNQHLSTGALLLEIGGHGNTLEQAVAAGILFAESVVNTLENSNIS